MASPWYVEKQGRRLGPFTGTQLKELAATGRLEPGDLVWRDDRTKAVLASEVRGLFAHEVGSEARTPEQAEDARLLTLGTEKPPPPPADDLVGSVADQGEIFKGLLYIAAVIVAFTLLGIWLMTAGGHPVIGFLTTLFFGGGGLVGFLVCNAEGRGWIAQAPRSTPSPSDIVPNGKEDREDFVASRVSSAPAWIEWLRIKDVGYAAVTLPILGGVFQLALSDTYPYRSPLFWYWGVCCLALPGVVHRRAAANPFEWAVASGLRSIVFFIAGVFGGVFLGVVLGLVRDGTMDEHFAFGFVLMSLMTLLIPNRLDVLLPVATASLFMANRVTTSRSAGLCPRCHGTGYCYVCRGQRVHLGGDCLDCHATGMCGECSGTGGRSVL
jgi:hypothetical protein